MVSIEQGAAYSYPAIWLNSWHGECEKVEKPALSLVTAVSFQYRYFFVMENRCLRYGVRMRL